MVKAVSPILRESDNADAFLTVNTLHVDYWTRVNLASDFTNATVTFTNITGFSLTVPANRHFIIEADLLILTPTGTNLPRIGWNIPALGTGAYGAGMVMYPSSTTTQAIAAGTFGTTAATIQAAAGGVGTANVPWNCQAVLKGRSGANANVNITLQMAAETAASGLLVKAGSEFRSRLL